MPHRAADKRGAMPFITAEPGLMTYELQIQNVEVYVRKHIPPCLIIRCVQETEEIYLSMKAE